MVTRSEVGRFPVFDTAVTTASFKPNTVNSIDRTTKLMSGRFLLFNQATGVLFRQLAEDVSAALPQPSVLYTGNAHEVLEELPQHSRLVVVKAPYYDRSSKLWKAVSWLRYTLGASIRIATARKTDFLLIVSNPPLLALWLWAITWFRDLRYGMLVYDIYPDVVVQAGILKPSNPVVRLWAAMNRRVYQRARVIITLGDRMAGLLQRQIGANPPVHVIPPWVETREIYPLPLTANPLASRLAPAGKRIVLYAGNMGTSHDIESVVEAAAELQGHDDIFFLLIGGGEKYRWAENYVAQHQLQNVRVAPYVPESDFPALLAMADVSIATQESGLENVMVPSKTVFYLAAGSALLAISNRPSELSDIVDRAPIGAVVPPGHPAQLAAELVKLLSDPKALAAMKSNARDLAVRHYSREKLTQRFVTLLAEAAMTAAETSAASSHQ